MSFIDSSLAQIEEEPNDHHYESLKMAFAEPSIQFEASQILWDVFGVESSDFKPNNKKSPEPQQKKHQQQQHQQQTYDSSVEAALLSSSEPLKLDDPNPPEIVVNGQRGLWANKKESDRWRGSVPLKDYPINKDDRPKVISKKTRRSLEYIQELAIRYLKPPTPPPPGDIVIVQQGNSVLPPAPPIILRQQPPRAATPEPLVIREAPPPPPSPAPGRKVITISGKHLPPPPRKVIIERLAPLPAKPRSVLIERWLPYTQHKRRVILKRTKHTDPVVMKPKNVIVQWEAPKVHIRKEFRYLGAIRANPFEYVQRYGHILKLSKDLPKFVKDIKTPPGILLAADCLPPQDTLHELYGDIEALKLIDLEKEGLSQYRTVIETLNANDDFNNLTFGSGVASFGTSSSNRQDEFSLDVTKFPSPNVTTTASTSTSSSDDSYEPEIFSSETLTTSISTTSDIDIDQFIDESVKSVKYETVNLERVTYDEAERIVLKLSHRIGKKYDQSLFKTLVANYDVNKDGTLSKEDVKKAFFSASY